MISGAKVLGVRELLSDIKRALSRVDQDNERALMEAGKPLLSAARAGAPVKTGALVSSGRIEVKGDQGAVVFGAKHAAAQEWSRRIRKGGSPPRFGYRALERSSVQKEMADEYDRVVGRTLELGG